MFFLLYHFNGAFTYSDVIRMSVKKRTWFINRLIKEKEKEYEEMERIRNSK